MRPEMIADIFFNENYCISIQIPLEFVPDGSVSTFSGNGLGLLLLTRINFNSSMDK